MLYEYKLKTEREKFYNITSKVKDTVARSGIKEGICVVFCPHTTAGITVNENTDPDVLHDLLIGLEAVFPDREEFLHLEGNSAAHLKSSFVGPCQTFIIAEGKILLGTWQGIYFCEFDGPRNRRFYIKTM